jgi:hypothetical protein
VLPEGFSVSVHCHAMLQVDESTSTVMLDTSGGAWITPAPGTLSGEDVTRRCRHAVTSVGPFVFIYGGLKGSQLLDDLLLAGEHACLVAMYPEPAESSWCVQPIVKVACISDLLPVLRSCWRRVAPCPALCL